MSRLPLTALYARIHAYSSNHQDALSFNGNQASLALVKNISAGVISEQRFLMKELTQFNAGFILPSKSGVFGLAGAYAGSQLYNESRLGLAYGKGLGKLNAGIQFNYLQETAMGFGHVSSINIEAGAILKVTDEFNAGVHIYNPTSSRIGGDDEERLPLIFSMGFGYDVSDKFFLGGLLEKTEDFPVSMNAGLQYCFSEKIFAKTGISTAVSSFYFGAGFLLGDVRIDAITILHQQLGLSPGLMIVYNKKGK